MSSLSLAIDIGGTNTKFALIDKDGSIVEKFRIPTRSNSFDQLVDDIKNSLGVHFNNIKNIGIGAPNVASNKLEIKDANNLGFKDAKVVEVFSKIFNVPITLENDANTAAIGEKKLGVCREVEDFVVLTIGTGLGSGVYVGDELFLGGSGVGAEIGHMNYLFGGRKCSCGQRGHVESYISCPGICLTYKEMHNKKIGFSELAQLYLSSDKEAVKTVKIFAHQLAQVCTNINAMLSPEVIVITGGGAILGKEFLKLVIQSYEQIEYSNFKQLTKIVLSDFSPEFGAIMGAYALTTL